MNILLNFSFISQFLDQTCLVVFRSHFWQFLGTLCPAGDQLGSDVCKANTLKPVLSFWPSHPYKFIISSKNSRQVLHFQAFTLS